MNKIITWSGYDWLTQERWGDIHPGKPWCWYDENQVYIYNDKLHLGAIYNPRPFVIDNKTVVSQYAIGLVTCETDFGFGRFEIEAKLPSGKGLWPAFWLYAANTWPPEIDIFEAYSGEYDYRGWFLQPYKIESCIHTRDEWKCKTFPAKSPCLLKFKEFPYESFNKYACEWTNKKLEFFINDKSVRKITNIRLLNHLSNYKMRVIINNHIDGRYKLDADSVSSFIIKSFKYEKF